MSPNLKVLIDDLKLTQFLEYMDYIYTFFLFWTVRRSNMPFQYWRLVYETYSSTQNSSKLMITFRNCRWFLIIFKQLSPVFLDVLLVPRNFLQNHFYASTIHKRVNEWHSTESNNFNFNFLLSLILTSIKKLVNSRLR